MAKKHQGITAVGYRTKGASGAFTNVPKLVAENSAASRPPADGPTNPNGGSYYSGENPTADIRHLDAAAHAALSALYVADTEIELELTLVGGDKEVIVGLPEVNRDEITGKAMGRIVYSLKVVGFATTPAA